MLFHWQLPHHCCSRRFEKTEPQRAAAAGRYVYACAPRKVAHVIVVDAAVAALFAAHAGPGCSQQLSAACQHTGMRPRLP